MLFRSIRIEHFWYQSQAHTIDKTWDLVSYYYNTEDNLYEQNLDCIYYRQSKSAYLPIITDLSPDITEREYGHVFFSTQIEYTLQYFKDTYNITPFREYYRQNKDKIYSTSFIKPDKGILYKENQNGSILKRPTTKGVVLNHLYRYLQSIQFQHTYVSYFQIRPSPFPSRPRPATYIVDGHTYYETRPPTGPPEEGLTTRILFSSLKTNHLIHDWNSWTSILPSNTPSSDYWNLPAFDFVEARSNAWPENPYDNYYRESRSLNQHIHFILNTRPHNKNACLKIELAYYTYKVRKAQSINN